MTKWEGVKGEAILIGFSASFALLTSVEMTEKCGNNPDRSGLSAQEIEYCFAPLGVWAFGC
ncbi:MAG: hypothetical protein H8D47_00930 [Planctomycetes bacterium]|nr:hypothetical protein [Planctomycetota bacterium]